MSSLSSEFSGWHNTLPSVCLSGADRLRRQAEEQERIARSYEGCSFVGEHPSAGPLRLAASLRMGAAAMDAMARKTARKSRKAKS